MSFLKRLKEIYEERPLGYSSILKKALNNTKTILDLGCGKNSSSIIRIQKKGWFRYTSTNY